MKIIATYPTAGGANVTVGESLLAPGPKWIVECTSCAKPRPFFAPEAAKGFAAGHAAKCDGQPPTIPGSNAIIITGWSTP